MRIFLTFLVASTAYIASAMPADNVVGEKAYPRYIEFPDGDGILHTVDLEAEPDQALLDEISRNTPNHRYFLFTRQNPNSPQELVMDNAESILNSNYDANLDTVFIVHGWLSTQYTQPNPIIREAFLGSYNVNVINVDWRTVSQRAYSTSVRGVPGVGRDVAQFINFLINTAGGSLDNFHLVGFSLGAHVVGNVGRALDGKVARITGLDPAGPLWLFNNDRLRPSDGVYVETVHTDGGIGGLGLGTSIADVDFYPNGGIAQPGCFNIVCNHEFAWALFSSSVTHNHLVGQQCETTLDINSNTCTGPSLHMGNADLRKTGRGNFRVNTGSIYPY